MGKFNLLMAIGFVFLAACGSRSVTPTMESIGKSSSPIVTSLAPRVQGKVETGVLQIIPVEKEEITQLGAPSCYGNETDYSFNADYKVIFKPNSGSIQEVADLPNLQIINEKEDFIQLDPLQIRGIDMFYFIPVKNKCRPSELYVFGVDPAGRAYRIHFKTDSGTNPTASIMADYKPQVVDNLLVIKSAEGDDMKIKNFIYKFEDKDKILKLLKKN